MTSRDFSERRCDHPDFTYTMYNGATPIVFVFDRPEKIPLTGTALQDYEQRKAKVEELGGHMRNGPYAGETPVFTATDIELMKAAIRKANPDVKILYHWNGEGCRTCSVGTTLGKNGK